MTSSSKKALFIMLCFVAFSGTLSAQFHMPASDTGNIDDVFQRYSGVKIQRLPYDEVATYRVESVHLASYVMIDTAGHVTSIETNPLYRVGNSLPEDHRIWQEIIDIIAARSEDWVFQPLLGDTVGLPEEAKRLVSSKAIWRPHMGIQGHMILWLYYPYYDEFVYDRVYTLKIKD